MMIAIYQVLRGRNSMDDLVQQLASNCCATHFIHWAEYQSMRNCFMEYSMNIFRNYCFAVVQPGIDPCSAHHHRHTAGAGASNHQTVDVDTLNFYAILGRGFSCKPQIKGITT